MASFGNYFRTTNAGTANTFTGNVTFAADTTVSGNVLDFAWNNPDTTFLNRTPNGETNPTVARFDFNGTSNQLQEAFTTFTTGSGTWATGSALTFGGGFGRLGKIRHALMQIFEEPSKEIKKEMTKKDRILLKAKRKSEKLLRQMLSKKEYDSLKLHGELEIPSSMEDEVIFIVKKDPNAMVDVKKNGKYSHKICAVAEDMEMPVGDQLLSKVLLLKTDEKAFREVAIRHA